MTIKFLEREIRMERSQFERIYLRGDTHGDFSFLSDFVEQEQSTSRDLMIILGDSGVNYFGKRSNQDHYVKEFISKMPITLLLIRGNHDRRPTGLPNIQRMYPEGFDPNIYSSPVYIESEYPNILYAEDGGKYYIHGKKYLTIGGAYSPDKELRLIRGWSWFKDEMLSPREMGQILRTIEGEDFDYVLTHTCPIEWQPTDLFMSGRDQDTICKDMEEFLTEVEKNITFKHWWFGHFHADRLDVCGDGKVTLLFNAFDRIR